MVSLKKFLSHHFLFPKHYNTIFVYLFHNYIIYFFLLILGLTGLCRLSRLTGLLGGDLVIRLVSLGCSVGTRSSVPPRWFCGLLMVPSSLVPDT
jgi:phosphoglycerol transferase MdoB-like AlkP superfamily enzyme